MSKPIKAMVSEELRARYQDVSNVCVVELTGLSVQQQEKLRAMVREKSGRLEVVRNSLARRAFADTPLEPLGKALEGPSALVVTQESLIDVAKALIEAAKEFKKLKLKQALYDGDPNLMTVEEVSKLRGIRELIGEVLMLITSPGRAVAGCIGGPQARVAGCLKAIADKEPAADAA